MIFFYLLLAVLLLLLNAFFVLAEFAAVKVRPTQMEALAEKGNRKAKKMQYIQSHIDQFLSVCQIGITFASIGLGFVGEPAIATLIRPLVYSFSTNQNADSAVHGIAILIAYILISFMHIVIGELVPKSIAIRKTEKAALLTVYPMLFFHFIFIIPLLILNSVANSILYLLRIPPIKGHEKHSEDEVRIILDQSQTTGMMSLRRLLFIENILDMGNLTVKNAMRMKSNTHCLKVNFSRTEIDEVISKYRYSRYPVLDERGSTPLGFIHIKDLYLMERSSGKTIDNIREIIRPCFKSKETNLLENVLSEMQRRGKHVTLVYDDKDCWTGIITLEDALEEVVGTIEEEYPVEPSVRLTNVMASSDYVVLDVKGDTIVSAARNALSSLKSDILPIPLNEIMPHISEREQSGSSYVGMDLAIPHARLKNISQAVVVFGRMKTPIKIDVSKQSEQVKYLFILLTPINTPRLHQILLARIAKLFESGFLESRLEDASSSQELYSAICTTEQATDMSL